MDASGMGEELSTGPASRWRASEQSRDSQGFSVPRCNPIPRASKTGCRDCRRGRVSSLFHPHSELTSESRRGGFLAGFVLQFPFRAGEWGTGSPKVSTMDVLGMVEGFSVLTLRPRNGCVAWVQGPCLNPWGLHRYPAARRAWRRGGVSRPGFAGPS
jgi:hypothetical protein